MSVLDTPWLFYEVIMYFLFRSEFIITRPTSGALQDEGKSISMARLLYDSAGGNGEGIDE